MAHLAQGWMNHLRRQAKGEQGAPGNAKEQPPASPEDETQETTNKNAADFDPQRPVAPTGTVVAAADAEDVARARKKLRSPTTSVDAGDRNRSPSPVRRSKAKYPTKEITTDSMTRPAPKGRLWREGDPPITTRAAAAPPIQQTPRASRRHANKSIGQEAEQEDPSVTHMIKQPETRPISQEQLVAEVKGIYAGLVMVESKCIEVDSAQSAQNESSPKLNNEQWQAIIALHRTLLHEHHDFFLASQHPSASPALRRLASKYAMPARMWRHGIHSFLELLRHRLPASLEHMLTFIYLAYSMMALLYETVPAFEDTWIECLGDLGRYRMAIEDEDIRDREIWTAVSRHWYSKASDKAPTTGRLYHHLAILARPNVVQQLFFYTKSLCVAIPFKSARDSILTLFDPILDGSPNRLQQIDVAFVKAHGILFIVSNTNEKEKPFPKPVDAFMAEFRQAKTEFLSLIDNHIARTTRGWLESGAFIAISNSNSLLEYGKTEANSQGNSNFAITAILPEPDGDTLMEGSDEDKPVPSEVFYEAAELNKACDAIVFRRYGDPNILPYLHVRLAFMLFMASKEAAMEHLEGSFPWALLVLMLNSLSTHFQHHDRIESQGFPRSTDRPLPDDWSLRGLLWTEGLFPSDWFHNDKVDDDEKTFELPSMTEDRKERVLWLGYRLASYGKWMTYDAQTKQFSVASRYDDPEVYKYEGYAPSEDLTLTEKASTLSRSSTLGSTTTLDQGSNKGDYEKSDGDLLDDDKDGTTIG